MAYLNEEMLSAVRITVPLLHLPWSKHVYSFFIVSVGEREYEQLFSFEEERTQITSFKEIQKQ